LSEAAEEDDCKSSPRNVGASGCSRMI